MPDVGEGLAEVEVVTWLVGVGDEVKENDPIAEVETDKALVTMPAPASGRILELTVKEGERLKVGALLLSMDVEEETGVVATRKAPSAVEEPTPPSPPSSPTRRSRADSVLASPAVRKLARQHEVDLVSVQGSGPRGRITMDDLERHVDALEQVDPAGVEVPGPSGTAIAEGMEVEQVPLKGLRRRIAEAMAHSVRTIPHVTGFHEVDGEPLATLRAKLRSKAESAGVRLTVLPFIVRALVESLEEHPYLNASIDEEAQVILLKKSFNIGIATATDEGLVVPVIHGADRLGVLELARRVEELTSLARRRRLEPEDMRQGTFTVTNVGPAGGWFGTSIIRHPESAILGVGRMAERPVVRDGRVVVGTVLPLALTFDHRVIDGDAALAFVQALRERLESPEQLMRYEPRG
jgi:pyruvate dehydrogenase E2 component (dihydrolipoamide acetyltransferase)